MQGRFPTELLDRLRAIDSPTISNAIETFDVRDRTEGFTGNDIRCLFPHLGVMLGYAVTAICDDRPGPLLGRQAYYEWLEAIEAAPKPVVCVFQDVSYNRVRACYMGEMMATFAKKLGAVGLITDGGVRDLAEVEALGFQYFSPGPVASHGNFAITKVGVPVTVSGMHVEPGALIHADHNGIVLIPDEIAERVPEAADKLREREKGLLEYVQGDVNARELIEKMSYR
jgi:4-hydroxy-4-methyl-2-oxoglutarate aldolase